MWSEGLNKITLKTEAASGKSPHTTNGVQRINRVFMKEIDDPIKRLIEH